MKLYIDKSLNLDENKIKLASEFCMFCADHLNIHTPFSIYMVADRKSHGIETTALYEIGNNCCRVYCKNRQLSDCLRSIAHEMTHMMQDQMGLIKVKLETPAVFTKTKQIQKQAKLSNYLQKVDLTEK